MKHFLTLVLLFFVAITSKAQILEPVKWQTSVEKLSDTEFNLVTTATIDKTWHLYSQEEVDGPIPTEFSYDTSNGDFELVGNTQEPNVAPVFDKIFQIDIKYFSDKAIFKQKIKLLNSEATTLNGMVFFSVCDDEKCLAPEEVNLVFNLSGASSQNTNNVVGSVD